MLYEVRILMPCFLNLIFNVKSRNLANGIVADTELE